MAFGDGIRRNIMEVSSDERKALRIAIIKLHQERVFPGKREDFPAGHVSYWFKQDEIHQATHVHGGPVFFPWHRELCNRFEAMLREVDPRLSLHYWDWNTDPAPLFTEDFMGNANGDALEPWLSAGFYVPGVEKLPGVEKDYFRDTSTHTLNTEPPGYPLHANPADPPKALRRNKQAGKPRVGEFTGESFWSKDEDIITATNFQTLNDLVQGCEMEDPSKKNCPHGLAHGYIGGTIGAAHTSFRDPFVFLLHSNLDRLWAMWQTQAGHSERLDPAKVYLDIEGKEDPELSEPLQPWAGESSWTTTTKGWPVRPWYNPEDLQVIKTSKDPSVVKPPRYDTNLGSTDSDGFTLDHDLPDISDGWALVGPAVNVIALAFWGGRLYAATSDKDQLLVRDAFSEGVAWSPLNSTLVPMVALAGVDGKLYASTPIFSKEKTALWVRDAVPTDSPWEAIGSNNADGIVAMAAGPDKPGGTNKLYAVTADGGLWSREPTAAEVDWIVIGTTKDVVGLGVSWFGNVSMLYAATSTNQLLGHNAANLDSKWHVLGHANDVAAMTAGIISAHSGAVFVATTKGDLWRLDTSGIS